MNESSDGVMNNKYVWVCRNRDGEICDVALSKASLEYRISRISAYDFKVYTEMALAVESAVNELLAKGYTLTQMNLVKMPECEDSNEK